MHVLLDGIPLGRGVDVDDDQRDRGDAALRSTIAVADERGIPRGTLSGTIQNDILKEYIARGTYIYPPGPSMRLVADTFAFCQAEVPRWNTISISGYHIREAGSDAVQEVAFTLADGIAYVEAALAAGLAVDAFAPRLSFFFNAHTNLLEEVAKFRAARRLWARIMRDRFGAQGSARADAPLPRADRGLDADGGAAAEQRRAHDDPGAGRGAGRRPVAAHQRLRRGAGAADRRRRRASRCARSRSSPTRPASPTSSIPLGGSYAVEALTSEIEARAAALIAEIDRRGGMVAAIEAGFPQREIERRAYEHQRAVEAGERVIVGVNRYADESAHGGPPPLHRLDPAFEAAQIARLAGVRSAPRRKQNARRAGCARGRPRAGPTTWSRRSWPPSRPVPRSARSPTCCATYSGNITPRDPLFTPR